MCNRNCIGFVERTVLPRDIIYKRVLEVGSLDVNGSVKPFIMQFKPYEYIGVDIQSGPSVDILCKAENLVDIFGPQSFDLVISTEMMEHIFDWKAAIDNMKTVLRPSGYIVITTRSLGFPRHDHPADYWRFDVEDMYRIFADYMIESVASDEQEPGVFIKAMKITDKNCINLAPYRLYSMVEQRRI